MAEPKIDLSKYKTPSDFAKELPEMVRYMDAARAGNNNQYKDDDKVFTPSELKAIQDGNYFNWIDATTHPAVMTNHSLSATGGDKVTTYAISAGYYFEDGLVDPQEYSRYNLRASVDVRPVDFVKFGINMYGTHSDRDTGNSDVLQDAIRMRPTYHPTNLVTGAEEWAYSNGQYNPLVAIKNEWNQTKQYNFLGNVYLELLPLKGLSLKTTLPTTSNSDATASTSPAFSPCWRPRPRI